MTTIKSNFTYMKKTNYLKVFIIIFLAISVLFPILKNEIILINKVFEFGFFKFMLIIFILGMIIEILINKQKTELRSKLTFFNLIVLVIIAFLILKIKSFF